MNVLRVEDSVIHICEEIGCGAFSEVLRGTMVKGGNLESNCAIKKIKCYKEEELERAEKEIKTLLKLEHENTTRIIGWSLANERFSKTIYIIMEYCNGGTLSKWLMRERHHIDHLKWMCDMSNGLKYLHDNGIAHRDLKPDNVLSMIGEKGAVLQLSDFGLSKHFWKQDKEGQCVLSPLKSQVGSLPWAAPEVHRGGEFDAKADIFSLGAICYGMLEECYIDDGKQRHHSAFVYIPGKGRIPYGKALARCKTLKIGICTGHGVLSDSLKKQTQQMLMFNPIQRPDAENVTQDLEAIGTKALQGAT